MKQLALLVIILFTLFSCGKKYHNELYLHLNNRTQDTILAKFYSVSGDTKSYTLCPDSNLLFCSCILTSTPNEILKAKYNKMELFFKDTTQVITFESDTTNNIFINQRWDFTKKSEETYHTNFTTNVDYIYYYVFFIYDVDK